MSLYESIITLGFGETRWYAGGYDLAEMDGYDLRSEYELWSIEWRRLHWREKLENTVLLDERDFIRSRLEVIRMALEQRKHVPFEIPLSGPGAGAPREAGKSQPVKEQAKPSGMPFDIGQPR